MRNAVSGIRNALWKRVRPAGALTKRLVFGHELYLHDETLTDERDYDQAWLAFLAAGSRVVFDVGANIGQSALLIALAGEEPEMFLFDPNRLALSAAAEMLIFNGLSSRVRFIPAFVDRTDGGVERLWTVGTGSAGSKYPGHAVTAAKRGSSTKVDTVTLDAICDAFGVLPDLVKIDVEGAERDVLCGFRKGAGHGRTRFLVEMHSNEPDLPMRQNAADVISWCRELDYDPWYLKEHVRLESPDQIAHRGRCHLLLQPRSWPYPERLAHVSQGDPLPETFPSAIERSSSAE